MKQLERIRKEYLPGLPDLLGLGCRRGGGGAVDLPAPPLAQEVIDFSMSDVGLPEDQREVSFSGFTDTAGFTTFTETTADGVRARIETWRAAPTGKIRIICDWDGISNMTTASLRGPTATTLTGLGLTNAGALGGFNRPTGGVWIVAASGRSPVFGAGGATPVDIQGVSRIFFENVGFSVNSGGSGSVITVWIRRPSGTIPLFPVTAFKNCSFGSAVHRPGDPPAQYARAITNALAHTVHLQDCRFEGVRQAVVGPVLHLRSFNSFFRRCIGDTHSQFGFSDSQWAGRTSSAWIEGCVVADVVDDAAFVGLHTDFFQYTSTPEARAGSKNLIRYNVTHQLNTAADDAGTQFVFGRFYAGSTESHDLCAYNNVAAYSAFWGTQYWDATGNGDLYVANNLFFRAGGTYGSNDSFQSIGVDASAVGPGTGTGTLTVQNNTVTTISDSAATLDVNSGNRYVDPRAGVVSGTGTTQGSPLRPEAVMSGAISRNGSDFMTYTIPGEAGVTSRAAAFWAIVDFMRPRSGWSGASPSNPATWPVAPARP